MAERNAGRELDVLIAEKVMGESLNLPRERALAIVGVTFVRATGRTFSIDAGNGPESLPMPKGESLPGHPSDDNWNQRYFRYVAQKLIERGGGIGQRVEKLVAACRLTPRSYSTDIAAAWLVVERLRANGFNVSVSADPATDMKYNYACEVARRQWRGSEYEEGATPAHAICLAALAIAGPGGVPAGDASDPEEQTND